MATPQIKLLNTVKALNEQGVVDLTASEKKQIEKETKDLIKNSKKRASAPEGFESIVDKLQDVSADEAFKIVTDFLADKGLLESHGKDEDKAEEVSSKMEEVMEKSEKGFGEGKKPEDKQEDLEGFDKEIPVEVEDKKESPLDEIFEGKDEDKEEGKDEEKKEHKGPAFGKDKPFGGKEEGPSEKGKPFGDKKDELKGDLMKDLSGDTGKLRDKVLAQAMELSSEEKKKRLLEMQEEDEDKPSDDMPSIGMTAKVKVIVTASRNLLVVKGGKPVFHAVVKEEIKKDPAKLARLANKVGGWLVSEGIDKTARKCNARLINSGADEGINFGGQELPEADKGIADEGKTDAELSHEGDVADSVQDGATFDNGEHKAHVARYTKISESVTDGATDEIVEDRVNREVEVTEGAADEIVEERAEKEENTQEDAQFDVKAIEAQYRTLYASRAKKAAEKAQEDFMGKFSRCLSIASQRMLKNLSFNPYKSASADVLMSQNIKFSNGDRYAGMDESAAVELTELVASEGHSKFIEYLVKNAIDLMSRHEDYLQDVEADLKNLAPVPVEVTASRRASNESIRDEAVEGSVVFQAKRATAGSHGNSSNDLVRKALSGTKTGNRLSKF